jgi:hypothetical protein
MPDISMCAVKDCPKSRECYRHRESGTKPNEYRQSYFMRPDDYKGPCEHFWPTHENGKKVTP